MASDMEFHTFRAEDFPNPYDADEQDNQRMILGILRRSGSSSTGDLVERSGMSRSSVLRIADRLCEKGLAIHVDTKGSRGMRPVGKPPFQYDFNASNVCIIAACIRDNMLEMAVTDALGRIRSLVREELYDDEESDSVIGRMARFVTQTRDFPACRDRRILGLGIATLGVVDSEAGVIRTAARFPSWGRDLPLECRLLERLGYQLPVRVDNILRMGALTEFRRRNPTPGSSLVYIYSGWDGLGAGIIVNGSILRGKDNLSGEIGHIMINPAETETCTCGSKGCFEQQVSPARLLRRSGSRNPRDLSTIFAGFRAGDEAATELMSDVIRWMAIGINIINLMLNPDDIVLSGIYREAGQGFLDSILDYAQNLAITALPKTLRLSYSETGEAAPLVGAAYCLADSYYS